MNFNLVDHILGKDDIRVVWLFNIGLEKYWSGDGYTVKSAQDHVVERMEEMNLLLAVPGDICILRSRPSVEFLDYISSMGFCIPEIICPEVQDNGEDISKLILKDDSFGERLGNIIGNDRAVLVPYGISELEEEISKKLDIPMWGSSSEINKKINNKVNSRKLALEKGFEVAPGEICKGFEELACKSEEYLKKYGRIIIKEPCGASGKGLWVIDSEAKLRSTMLIIKRFYKARLSQEWLVEKWCSKDMDLNYQIYVGSTVEVFSIKEQIVDGTVYVGSFVPPDINDSIKEQCSNCGKIIGEALKKQGYQGILGVDAMVVDGKLIPIIEINGRFTLSTYVSFLRQQLNISSKYMAFYLKVNLEKGDSHNKFADKLAGMNMQFDGEKGAIIYTGYNLDYEKMGKTGRLFCVMFGEDRNEILDNYKKIKEMVNY